MLFTRCPDCDTTFRVTDEALKKANGQVRCGRCASVFNAYAELHELEPNAAAPTPKGPPDSPADAATTPALAPQPEEAAPPPRSPAPPLETSRPRPGPTAVDIDAAAVANVVAEVERATVDEVAADEALEATTQQDDDAISAAEVEDVLTMLGGLQPQTLVADEATAGRRRRWGVAVAVACVILGLQGINHYRAALAGHSTVGPWLQQAYSMLGVTVTPRWDVHQYEILDWVATAEPNLRGLGSLKITARIKNNGPQRQPYPAVNLRLKDRWEKAVGSRMFAPAEYLPRDTPRGRLMAVGETTRAEIEVVDPGPDAYGFELDICIEVEAATLSCGTDKVFL